MILLCMYVMSPPPCLCILSVLIGVKFVILGVLWCVCSFVSCTVMMSMLCVLIVCSSSVCFLCIPFMFI